MTIPDIPELSHSQKQAIFQLACQRVIAATSRQPKVRADELLGKELSRWTILGAFVSLKRGGSLRACMGCLAQEQMPLGIAVETAAARSANKDPRFPPVSPTELSGLEVEVWILGGMRKIEEKGRDRLNAVEIGKHGLQISRKNKKGLLLPGVAEERHFDAMQFLEAVCKKAGLPTDAWIDDNAEISVFEGMVISGDLSDALARERIQESFSTPPKGPCRRDVIGLCNAARDNFFRHLDGMTPSYYQPEFYDGNMTGVGLTITLPDVSPLTCAKNGVRADVPLQSALSEFAGALAEQIRRVGPDTIDLLQTKFDLFVQWDVAIHGSLESHDLSGIDTRRRSLMLSVGNRWAMVYNESQTAEQLFDLLFEKLDADTFSDETSCVYSFETLSTTNNFALESEYRPPIFPKLRPAALAGAFYPKLAKEIEAELNRMFAPGDVVQDAPLQNNISQDNNAQNNILSTFGKEQTTPIPLDSPIPAIAALVPHAGWIFSGRLTAQTLARTIIPETVFIFAPKHRAGGANWAVAPYETWGTPFRQVAADFRWASQLADSVRCFQFDEMPHKHEHAIEVLLPILSRLKPDVKVVGVTMTGGDWQEIAESAAQFANLLRHEQTLPRPLFIISSDMNHFATEETTRMVDKIALDAVATLNPERFFETVVSKQISMCGVYAAAFVLQTLQSLGVLRKSVPIGYTTSGARSGDLQRVVGYAGMLFQ
ncbi:MAG: AmmeMemoRadiSam system protein B [Planctomycetaceae bacterium]|jgi:AmmeMemoRadiSam system protein B/AmmeMemoRadiSam system protein A|nr:AmmeMemoRadiSam system protein B [Planctomycetaceae bacterium]